MKHRINRERIKAFVLRKKANFFGLLAITALSVVITLLASLSGFRRTGILAVVSVLLVFLCLLQLYKMRSSYRTMHSFRGFRKRKDERNNRG